MSIFAKPKSKQEKDKENIPEGVLPDISDILKADTQKRKHELEMLGELFSIEDIETKTELTPKQVVLINQKRTIAKLLGWKELDASLDDFMLLQISKERKGRAEFVDGFKSDREQRVGAENQNRGFFNRMFNR